MAETFDFDDDAPVPDRKLLFTPIVENLVNALGGVETLAGEEQYVPGDSCVKTLQDLKKIWRRDDTDDERTIARIMWNTKTFMKDLVPILLVTAGRGLVGDKRALFAGEQCDASNATSLNQLHSRPYNVDDLADRRGRRVEGVGRRAGRQNRLYDAHRGPAKL